MPKGNPIEALNLLVSSGKVEMVGQSLVIQIPRSAIDDDALECLQDYGALTTKGSISEDSAGTVSIDLHWPGNENTYCIYSNWASLLKSRPRFGNGFIAYYILDKKIIIDGKCPSSGMAKSYVQVSRFIECLYLVADHKGADEDVDELTFINASSILIKIIISKKYLCEIIELEKFSALCSLDCPRRDSFSAIVKNNLSHFLASSEQSNRLNLLVLRSKEFIEKCLAEHAIYCNDKSYSEVLGAVRKECVSYIGEIEKISSSLYIKSLILPASFVLLGKEALSPERTNGLIATSGAVLFTACGIALVISHMNTLRYLSSSIKDRTSDLAIEFGVSNKEIADRFLVIKNRIDKYWNYSIVILVIIAVFLVWFLIQVHIFSRHAA